MPSLSSFCAVEKPRKPFLDQEGGDAARAGLRVGLGVDHQNVRVRAVGDPHLVAVQHVAVAALVGAQAHGHHVAARARLGHRQRAHVLAGDQPRQVAALLLLRAVAADLVDAEVGVRAVGQADRGRGAADLLHGHHVLEVAHAGAAVLLLHGDAEDAEVAELAPEVGGNSLRASISAARGATSAAAKRATSARRASAVSPRPKSGPVGC
jgi:hypothetical protein